MLIEIADNVVSRPIWAVGFHSRRAELACKTFQLSMLTTLVTSSTVVSPSVSSSAA